VSRNFPISSGVFRHTYEKSNLDQACKVNSYMDDNLNQNKGIIVLLFSDLLLP